ncbi:flagellar export protein FliJ [bacterium]|nr:flagellar export protein FliJ [bacterium]
MPFRYRLQKILDFRIRKKEAQLIAVQKAQQEVYAAEERIRQNEAEIQQTILNKKTADFKMMEYYDNYLHHLWDKADALEQERQRLQAILDQEKEKLVKCEQEVKVVEKHKEKQKDAYIEEEKAQELKQFSEIGVQRFFIQSRETAEEQELEKELNRILQEETEVQ